MGGLGNQLFIYAAGYAAASRQSIHLYIDDSWFSTQSVRSYELDTFESTGTVVSDKKKLFFARRTRPARFARKIANRLNVPSFTTVSEEKAFTVNSAIISAAPGVRLTGYLQSYKYFEDFADHIREQLVSIVDPTPWFFETFGSLAALGPWIAVHVRRGDFLNQGTRQVHGVVARCYYSNALKLMGNLIPGATPVVFSDDPVAARRMLEDENPSAIYIDSPATSKDIESVVLMSQSDGSIIANSTFSWWGAWLGDKEGRPVIAPRPWMDEPSFHERDLLPPNWLTLGRTL